MNVDAGMYADMKDESNWLLRDALPVLQDFALQIGVQIQLVDLHWGIDEDTRRDPDIGSVHLEQIRLCRQYSSGPNFVVSLRSSVSFVYHCTIDLEKLLFA